MKNIVNILLAVICSLSLTSCYELECAAAVTADVAVTAAAVSAVTSGKTVIMSYDYTYYDYMYEYPVVYISGNPFYQIWYNDAWVWHPVPMNRFCYIRRYDMIHTFRSNMPVPRGFDAYMRNGRRIEQMQAGRRGGFQEARPQEGEKQMFRIGNDQKANPQMMNQQENRQQNQNQKNIRQQNQNQKNIRQQVPQQQRTNQIQRQNFNIRNQSSSRVTVGGMNQRQSAPVQIPMGRTGAGRR